MKITFFGTTTLLFDDGKDQIFFDCHFTRPGLLKYIAGSGSTDKELADRLIKTHRIDRLKAIFVSHTHHDHVMDAPYVANCTNATIYGSLSAMNVGRGGNVPEDRLIRFEAGGTYSVGDYSIKVIKSVHSKPTALNNDLGQEITQPLTQPARLRNYKEGGSYDFIVRAQGKTYVIRPSFNYIEGQLDGIKADCLFLGIAGLAKADIPTERKFFEETVEKVNPSLIIPLHWDNFFTSLDKPVKSMPSFVEKTNVAFHRLSLYCEKKGIPTVTQMPLTSIEL